MKRRTKILIAACLVLAGVFLLLEQGQLQLFSAEKMGREVMLDAAENISVLPPIPQSILLRPITGSIVMVAIAGGIFLSSSIKEHRDEA